MAVVQWFSNSSYKPRVCLILRLSDQNINLVPSKSTPLLMSLNLCTHLLIYHSGLTGLVVCVPALKAVDPGSVHRSNRLFRAIRTGNPYPVCHELDKRCVGWWLVIQTVSECWRLQPPDQIGKMYNSSQSDIHHILSSWAKMGPERG